jgi:nickel-dependent lactate racemase
MRENETRVQEMAALCVAVLQFARQHLTILDPEVGEEELIKAVAAEVVRVRALSHSV